MRTIGIAACMSAIAMHCSLHAQTAEVEQKWWIPNGAVRAIAEDTLTGTVYLGGDFTTIGPPQVVKYSAALSVASGTPAFGQALPDERVRCSVPDGSGGIYIGGGFLHLNGASRSHVAHLNADGTLDAWAPSVDGEVDAMALKGDTLVIAGDFDMVNGSNRHDLALVHRTTGALMSLDVLFQGDEPSLTCAMIVGNRLIVGGFFTAVYSTTRNNIAALDLTTGALLPWDPNIDNGVYSLALDGNLLYVGGVFASAGAAARNRLAAVDVVTGLATAWNPGANSTVSALAVSAGQVYIGGSFTTCGGSTRNHLAQVSTAGVLSSWAPDVNNPVYAMLVQASTVYIGGGFTAVNGSTRNRLAALGVPGSSVPTLTSWSPDASGNVLSLSLMGTRIHAGGEFTTIGTRNRARLVALDGVTGEPTDWNPGANASVYTLCVANNQVYAGGDFTILGGNNSSRTRIGSISPTTGLCTPWNPQIDATVRDIVATSATIYAAGSFATINGTAHRGLAGINASGSGTLTSWNVTTGGPGQVVEQMILSGDTLFVCGTFSTLNGVTRGPLASVRTTSNAVTAFAPMPNDFVHTMAKRGNVIYASGYFTTIGGVGGQQFVAGVNATTGAHSGWNPNVNGPQFGICADDRSVVFACTKPDENGVNVGGLHGFAFTNAQLTGFHLALDNSTWCVERAKNGSLLVGGLFTTVNGAARQGFAVVKDAPAIHMNAKLGGCYDAGGWMWDLLRQANQLPMTEPYTALGYVHHGGGGGEALSPSVASYSGGGAIVDWVVVELRDAADPSLTVATRSALVRRNGELCDAKGNLLQCFPPDPNALYYVALHHRNHLGVMTATPMSLKNNVVIPFNDPLFPTYGTEARVASMYSPYPMLLWPGDVNGDGVLKYTGTNNDRDPILLFVGSTTPNNVANAQYRKEDVNMGNTVKYTGVDNDRDPILVGVGGTVPTNTRVEQVP
jgi:hypothetical protein